MKNIILLAALGLLFFCHNLKAQGEIKHQTEELESIQVGNYTAYLTQQSSSGDYQGGLDVLLYKITNFKDYRIQPGAHKEVYMLFGENAKRPDDHKESMFIPDNEAFPITYVHNVYEGSPAMQDEIGFAPRKIHQSTYDSRLVFLDGKIYILKEWVDKDNYKLKAVLEYQAKKMGGLKKMKEVMKSPKKMKAMQPHKTLQEYLDNAYNKQQEVYAEWLKTPKNAALVENTESTRKFIIAAINKQRDDWMNSEEYKRIKERNQMARQSDLENRVHIVNKTGKEIYIYKEGSRNGSRLSTHFGGAKFDCKKNLYYSFSGNSSASNGTLIVRANQSCGTTVNVN
ncbi:hypothetical protein ATO12_15345 [Aquimarina atlantica]|uniref:Uncharacterized protein n=1 Tax=Aquimarina atlantica TaxID=1317122 RepID=A0A023BWB5_9FLAO|nr:hypothetical protein [Aquimarina atlantica]EZH74239.1 hypothetical protein ATO12_15345 [Aquimarina atlantica]